MKQPAGKPIRINQSDIIDISAKLFAERGYWASNLRDIAEQLEVTAAAIYYHFKKKEDILKYIVFTGLDEIYYEVQRAFASENMPEENLEAIVRLHLKWCMKNPHVTKIIIEESRFLQDDDYETSKSKQKDILRLYKGALKDCLPSHLKSERNLSIAAFNIVAVVLGWYRWYRPDDYITCEQALEQCIDFAIRGAGCKS